jgi:hypothetical protein
VAVSPTMARRHSGVAVDTQAGTAAVALTS